MQIAAVPGAGDDVAPAEVFRRLYEDDGSTWGKGSGAGSSPYHTIEYRGFIDKFIRMNNVASIVDIGCGDWQFSRFLNLDGVRYTGLDVVASVIERVAKKYASETIRFGLMPEDWSQLPPADLLLLKDVLQHVPDAEIRRFRDIAFPKYKTCLITNSYRKLNTPRNVDIRPGGFRCLDLQAPPYSLRGSYVLEFSTGLSEWVRTLLHTPP
jgi:SAM-dependent methyltransferase